MLSRFFLIVIALLIEILPLEAFDIEKNFREYLAKHMLNQDFTINIFQLAQAKNATAGNDVYFSDLVISDNSDHFSVNVHLDEKKSFVLKGEIIQRTFMPVLTHAISPGHIISKNDITFKAFPIKSIRPQYITDIQNIIGKESRHSFLNPNQPIEQNQLKNPLVVKRGDMVNVSYHGISVQVTAKMSATADYSLNDTGVFELIKFENGRKITKKVTAKVTGPQRAEIYHA